MPTVENSEFIPSTSDGLQNTPVNKHIVDIQQNFHDYHYLTHLLSN